MHLEICIFYEQNNGIMISYFQLHKIIFFYLETLDNKLWFGTKIIKQWYILKNGSHVHVCKKCINMGFLWTGQWLVDNDIIVQPVAKYQSLAKHILCLESKGLLNYIASLKKHITMCIINGKAMYLSRRYSKSNAVTKFPLE